MIDRQLFDNKEFTLKKFLPQLTPNRLFVTWILTVPFLLLTVLWVILIWRYNLDYFEVANNFRGLERLMTGGTIRSLAIEGGQWWRIFTYGFAAAGYGIFLNLIITAFLGTIFFKLLKYNEGINGPLRTALGFSGTYILTGFVLSVLGGPFAYGGVSVTAAIIVGMLVGTVGNHKNQVFDLMRIKLIWPILLFVLLPLFTSVGDWIGSGFGFVIGMAMMNLIHFRLHGSLTSIILSAVFLGIIFVLALIFALIPLPYGLAKDPVVIQMLYVQSYYNLALSRNGAEAIMARLHWGKFEIPEETLFYLAQMFKF